MTLPRWAAPSGYTAPRGGLVTLARSVITSGVYFVAVGTIYFALPHDASLDPKSSHEERYLISIA